MKKLVPFFLIASLISLACIGGCRQDSREYLQALEANDRLIESSHQARKDMIDSLGRKSLSRADRAMDQEGRLEEQSLYVQGILDNFRPHVPNAVLYEQASELAKSLEQDRNNLLGKWVEASKDANPDVAKELSSKIRDVELALSEASETAKRSRPIGASLRSSSDEVLAREIAPDEQR
jgi:outer membrane lipopolysaccharide assembly protein LptE/RlpB